MPARGRDARCEKAAGLRRVGQDLPRRMPLRAQAIRSRRRSQAGDGLQLLDLHRARISALDRAARKTAAADARIQPCCLHFQDQHVEPPFLPQVRMRPRRPTAFTSTPMRRRGRAVSSLGSKSSTAAVSRQPRFALPRRTAPNPPLCVIPTSKQSAPVPAHPIAPAAVSEFACRLRARDL